MTCPRCGQPGEVGRYCGRCGLLLTGPVDPAPPGGPVHWDKPTRQWPVTPPVPDPRVGTAPSYPPPDPATRYLAPGSPPGSAGPVPRAPRNSRALLLAAVVVLVVVAAGVVTLLSFRGGSDTTAATAIMAAPPSTAPPGTAPPGTTPPGTPTSGSTATPGAAAGAPSTVVETTTVTPPTTAATGLSDVPAQSIACNSGYFVQVASESDQAAFLRRVDQVRAAGQLPAGSRWTEVGASCPVFTATGNLPVLWSGPFTTVADACTTRLAGPWDAAVKGTVPGSVAANSCLCPAASNALPILDAGSARSQWTGELQRLLDQKLDYGVGEMNADTWGVYTPATADAVRRFQADRGLSTTGQVDPATWSALQGAGC